VNIFTMPASKTASNNDNSTSTSIAIIGCGWLGTPLARHFIDRGFTVRGTTTSRDKLEALQQAGIDASVYRLGSETDAVPVAERYIINIPPSRIADYPAKLAMLLKSIPAQARQILFCSTTSVYGNAPGRVVESDVSPGEILPAGIDDEARHGTPRSVLLQAEGVMAADSRTTILRLAGLIGGGRNPARFLAGRTGLSQPDAPVNLVHLEDLISVFSALVDQHITGGVFNVCAAAHPSRKAYYTAAAGNAGLSLPEFDETDTRGGKEIDSSALETLIGLRLSRIHP